MDFMILGESSSCVTVREWLALLAMLMVAFMAVFQQKIWSFWRRPKLRLEAPKELGTFVETSPGKKMRFYSYLHVVNDRPKTAVSRCRVWLKGVWRWVPEEKRWHKDLFPAPLQVHWCFPYSTFEDGTSKVYRIPDRYRGFPDWHTIDLVHLEKDGRDDAVLGLYTEPNNFEGHVKPGESIRYRLQVVAEDFVPDLDQVFEVSWEGGWTDNLELMKQKLVVQDVSGEMQGELRNRRGRP